MQLAERDRRDSGLDWQVKRLGPPAAITTEVSRMAPLTVRPGVIHGHL